MERGVPGSAPSLPEASGFGAKLLRVAGLGTLLGVAMEASFLFLSLAVGAASALAPAVADFARGVSWSVFVCVGLAAAMGFAKGRLPFAGVGGFVAAPVAFEGSRIVHTGVVAALAASSLGAGDGYPVAISVVKGLEYGFLALAIGWVASRPWGGALAHAAAGLVAGVLFGGALSYIAAGSGTSGFDLFSVGLNELLFPIGCAMVLFLSDALEGRG